MLNKITAAALSTVLCVTNALPYSISSADENNLEINDIVSSNQLVLSADAAEEVSEDSVEALEADV